MGVYGANHILTKHKKHLDAMRQNEAAMYGYVADVDEARRIFAMGVDLAKRSHKAAEERMYVARDHTAYERTARGIIELNKKFYLRKPVSKPTSLDVG